MLSCSVRKRLGGFQLDLSLSAESGGTLVVVGESGAGKSTLLRMLAGLARPDEGSIEVDGAEWFSSAHGVWWPADQRSVGMVTQDYALFPHLTALDNVAFGLRASGVRAAPSRHRAASMLERIGIGQLAGRRPAELSGGQQQRVALARALVLEPRLLLLDEPLSALDVQTRREVRGELRSLLATLSCITVYVTHSPLEALTFGDRLAVLDAGLLAQSGSGSDLLRHPRSAYVAEFIGINLFHGIIETRGDGLANVRLPAGTISVVDPGGAGTVFAAVDPRDITLHIDPPGGSTQNVRRGPVIEMIPEPPRGERVRIVVGSSPPLVAELSRASAEGMGLEVGKQVFAAFKAVGVTVYR
ncbi:MAG: ABC transporter ATP-binding protein [Gemmatimonadota bacterium]